MNFYKSAHIQYVTCIVKTTKKPAGGSSCGLSSYNPVVKSYFLKRIFPFG
jgi:hypothetical protein